MGLTRLYDGGLMGFWEELPEASNMASWEILEIRKEYVAYNNRQFMFLMGRVLSMGALFNGKCVPSRPFPFWGVCAIFFCVSLLCFF